ncbi:MAG: hypothetical protein ACXQTP_03225 [Candidatus Methanofastidiosia archaeon]
MNRLEEILSEIKDEDIEKIYWGIKKKEFAHKSAMVLQKIKNTLLLFSQEYVRAGIDTALYRSLVSIDRKIKVVIPPLERYLLDIGEGRTPAIDANAAQKLVSNLHLLINGLRGMAREVKRKSEK